MTYRFHTLAILLLGATLVAGCGPNRRPRATDPLSGDPSQQGLAGQKLGVMVWADRGVLIDFPTVQLDLANAVQNQVRQINSPEIKEASWPVLPASIVRYQREHPGIEYQPITDVAPKLGVTRLLYVELERLSTRSEASLQMYRGNARATLRIVEVNNGTARVGFEAANIRAIYPPKSRPEGVLNSDDIRIYRGTVAALAEAIAARLSEPAPQ